MAYLKPQSPIKYNEDHIYPLTTVDQIIMDDGQRLSGVCVYLEAPEESEDTTVETGVNAATLGGILPSGYVLDSELDEYKNEVETNYLLKTDSAADSEQLNGYDFNALKAYMLDLAHPVGSYYWSSESTNPTSLFGGTWEQIKDQFILAAGDSYAVGATGGEATHRLTSSEIPNTQVQAMYYANASSADTGSSWTSDNQFLHAVARKIPTTSFDDMINGSSTDKGGDVIYNLSVQGGNGDHNNMPPYLVAYCWRRTA